MADILFEPKDIMHKIAVKFTHAFLPEAKTLKAVVPPGLVAGAAYTLLVVTQSSTKTSHHVMKNLREMRSEFTVTAQA